LQKVPESCRKGPASSAKARSGIRTAGKAKCARGGSKEEEEEDRPAGAEQTWRCRLCLLVKRRPPNAGPLWRQYTIANHLRKAHKKELQEERARGVKNTRFGAREYVDVPVPTAQMPQEQRAWTCYVCKRGLGHHERSVHEKAVREHFKAEHPAITAQEAYDALRKDVIGTRDATRKHFKELAAKKSAEALELYRRQLGPLGHDIQEVDLDLPGTAQGRNKYKCCVRCRLNGRELTVQWRKGCRRKCDPSLKTPSRTWWQKIAPRGGNEKLLRETWGLTEERVQELMQTTKGRKTCRKSKGEDGLQKKGAKRVGNVIDSAAAVKKSKKQEKNERVRRLVQEEVPTCPVTSGGSQSLAAPDGDNQQGQQDGSSGDDQGSEVNEEAEGKSGKKRKKGSRVTQDPTLGRGTAGASKPPKCRRKEKSTPLQGTVWIRNVCEDGDVEPHPGPQKSGLHCVNVNVGGSAGVWRAYEELIRSSDTCEADVITMQECRLHDDERRAFADSVHRCGWRCHYLKGRQGSDGWQNRTELGGNMVLCRKTLRQRAVGAWTTQMSLLMAVLVCGVVIFNAYAPPNPQAIQEHATLTMEAFEATKAREGRWLYAGDLNEEFHESATGKILQYNGGEAGRRLEPNEGSRWNSTRKVDWVVSNLGRKVGLSTYMDVWISDHKVMHFEVLTRNASTWQRKLEDKPAYKKPQSLTSEQWKKLLKEEWIAEAASREAQKLEELLQGDVVDVNAEWQLYQELLENMFRGALAEHEAGLEADSEEAKTIREVLRRRSRKGGDVKAVQRNTTTESTKVDVDSEEVRALRRKLARTHRLCRTLQTNTHEEERLILLRRVLGAEASAKEWEERPIKARQADARKMVEEGTAKLRKAEQQQATRRIASWRAKMRSGIAAVSKWLKAKRSCGPVSVACDGKVAETGEEAAEMIKERWRKVSERSGNEQQRQVQAKRSAEKLVRDFVGSGVSEPLQWNGPSEEQMAEGLKSAKGAGGIDGWQAYELKCVPAEAAQMFARVSRRWVQAGEAPMEMRNMRQVNLPKPGKIDEKTCTIDVNQVRPLSIASMWWRVWARQWVVSDEVQEWIDSYISDAVIGGRRGFAAEAEMSEFFDELVEKGFGGSLDYSLAFDMMDPLITCETLKGLGWPQGLVDLIGSVWLRQSRWISWDQHVADGPLEVSQSMPQGDAWSVLMMIVWMEAGVKSVQQQVPEDCKHMVYIDDRSWTTDNANTNMRVAEAWRHWSSEMCLKENVAKTQFVATTERARKELQQAAGEDGKEYVKDVLHVLGTHSRGTKQRKTLPKEQQRIEEAASTVDKIGALPIGWEAKVQYIRSFGLSKALWGWVARAPTKADTDKFQKAVWNALRVPKGCNQHMRNVLIGGVLNMRMVLNGRTFALVLRRISKSGLQWTKEAKTLVGRVRKSMASDGWEEQAAFQWRHRLTEAEVHLMQHMDLSKEVTGKIAHDLREGWRAEEWEKFRHATRRDSALLQAMPYDGVRAAAARKACTRDGWHRAVLLGTFRSPASMTHKDEKEQECPWCHNHLGYHDHIFWSCPQRPHGPRRPRCELQARLGWPMAADDSRETDEAVMTYMSSIAKMVLDERYHKAPASGGEQDA